MRFIHLLQRGRGSSCDAAPAVESKGLFGIAVTGSALKEARAAPQPVAHQQGKTTLSPRAVGGGQATWMYRFLQGVFFLALGALIVQQCWAADLAGPELPLAEFPSATGGNVASVQQTGDDNEAFVDQAGASNAAHLLQSGKAGEIRAMQRGSGNRANLSQSGSANRIDLAQTGKNNDASVAQEGKGNRANVVQAGNDNSARVRQVGVGNQADIQQYTSSSKAVVTQYGDGNFAKMIQH